jgi:hypothetical protein
MDIAFIRSFEAPPIRNARRMSPKIEPQNVYAVEPQGPSAVSRRDWETKPVLELLAGVLWTSMIL